MSLLVQGAYWSLAPAMDTMRPERLAKNIASDRLAGGSGLIPFRPEGQGKNLEFRLRQAAFDLICELRTSPTCKKLLADWGLTEADGIDIQAVVTELSESSCAVECIREQTDERSRTLNAVASQHLSVIRRHEVEVVSIGNQDYTLHGIREMSEDDRKDLSFKFLVSSYLSEVLRIPESLKKDGFRIPSHQTGPAAHLKLTEAIFQICPCSTKTLRRYVNNKSTKLPLDIQDIKRPAIGRPTSFSRSIADQLARYIAMLRAYKYPTTRLFILSGFMRLVDGTKLAAKVQNKSGDWDIYKLNNWYYRDFMGQHKELHSGAQRPLELARDSWGTSANAEIFYNQVRDMLVKRGIARRNDAWTPFAITEEHLAMTLKQLKQAIRQHPCEILINSDQAWRIISLDEVKVQMSTHDDNSGKRQCEKVVKAGPHDDGATLSAKSGNVLSVVGGSHANLDPIPMHAAFAAQSVNPTWMLGAPTATVLGHTFMADYSCNEKGSILGENIMSRLKYLNELRAFQHCEDSWVVALMDGCQTHLTEAMLTFYHFNKIDLGLRPPNTSERIQNEDLVTFWILRNDASYGFNLLKQQHFFTVLRDAARTSLNFADFVATFCKSWSNCMQPRHQLMAWIKGGVSPFSREPELIMRWEEMQRDQREELMRQDRKKKDSAASKQATYGMNQEDELNWQALMKSNPVATGPQRKCTKAGGGGDDLEGGETISTSRLNSSEIFTCPPLKRIHKGTFFTQLKAIKAAAKPKLEHWIAEIKVVEPLWDFRLKQKPPVDEMKVALIEWSSKRWGIKVEDSFFPKELMVKRNQRRGIVTKTSAAVKVEKEIPSIFSFREKADEMVPACRSMGERPPPLPPPTVPDHRTQHPSPPFAGVPKVPSPSNNIIKRPRLSTPPPPPTVPDHRTQRPSPPFAGVPKVPSPSNNIIKRPRLSTPLPMASLNGPYHVSRQPFTPPSRLIRNAVSEHQMGACSTPQRYFLSPSSHPPPLLLQSQWSFNPPYQQLPHQSSPHELMRCHINYETVRQFSWAICNLAEDAPVINLPAGAGGADLTLHVKHFTRLISCGSWLYDETVNVYMYLLSDRYRESYFFNSYFFEQLLNPTNQDACKRWVKNITHPQGVFGLKKILIPVNIGNVHWALVVAFMQERRLVYYDSKFAQVPDHGMKYLVAMERYLHNEAARLLEAKKVAPGQVDVRPWEKVLGSVSTPQQVEDDCGVFTCITASYIVQDLELRFSRNDIYYYRSRMTLELLHRKLFP